MIHTKCQALFLQEDDSHEILTDFLKKKFNMFSATFVIGAFRLRLQTGRVQKILGIWAVLYMRHYSL